MKKSISFFPMAIFIAIMGYAASRNSNVQEFANDLLLDQCSALAQNESTSDSKDESYAKHDCTLVLDDGTTLDDSYWTCEPNGDDECCMPIESMCQKQ